MGNIKRYLVKILFIFGIALPNIVSAGGADIVIGTPGNNVTLWHGFNSSHFRGWAR